MRLYFGALLEGLDGLILAAFAQMKQTEGERSISNETAYGECDTQRKGVTNDRDVKQQQETDGKHRQNHASFETFDHNVYFASARARRQGPTVLERREKRENIRLAA